MDRINAKNYTVDYSTSEKMTHPTEKTGLSNFAMLHPWLFRGARPTREGVDELAKMGVRTILNLESDFLDLSPDVKKEKKWAKSAGLNFISLPIKPLPNKSAVKKYLQKAVKVFTDPDNHPVFVHCKHGKDRTGMTVAAYRILVDNWRPDSAVKELDRFGFHNFPFKHWKELPYELKED